MPGLIHSSWYSNIRRRLSAKTLGWLLVRRYLLAISRNIWLCRAADIKEFPSAGKSVNSPWNTFLQNDWNNFAVGYLQKEGFLTKLKNPNLTFKALTLPSQKELFSSEYKFQKLGFRNSKLGNKRRKQFLAKMWLKMGEKFENFSPTILWEANEIWYIVQNLNWASSWNCWRSFQKIF